ncbi:phosphoribosyltransferase family protein [Nonomuraea sp. NPDC050790]|uniref:phosphoribosyltransferase family protein n=1 Tax=Nonomuraea sp. NPDC050790 TaxID=3364371 RepID=UPI0037BB2887
MTSAARDLVLEHFTWIDGHADVWSIFRDSRAFAAVIAKLAEPFRGAQVTAVCGIESRGFLLGGAVAVELGVGFVPIRKGSGLFPGVKVERHTAPDYRRLEHLLRVQRSSLGPTDRLVLVDDWIETGNQASAVRDMVLECGSSWAGCSVIVDQLDEGQAREVGPVHSVVRFNELPVDEIGTKTR